MLTWANSFINSIEKSGGGIEEGIETLNVLAPWVKSFPGANFGVAAAEKLEPLIRNAFFLTSGDISGSEETAIRFLLLMVRRNTFRYFNSIMAEIKNILDEKNGIVSAYLEYAFEPDEKTKMEIIESIKNRTGAVKVELNGCINQALIGGYRLIIKDEIIDVSVRCKLEKLKNSLANGQ
jgi:F-type H+-transporting ATPase subunit delta